jgi:hypothetical protein
MSGYLNAITAFHTEEETPAWPCQESNSWFFGVPAAESAQEMKATLKVPGLI